MRKSQEGRALRQFTLSTGKSAGRNSSGRITVFHRGGGSKRLQRRIDLKRSTSSMGIVERIEYDPNRSSRIAPVRWIEGVQLQLRRQRKCNTIEEFAPPRKILEPTTTFLPELFILAIPLLLSCFFVICGVPFVTFSESEPIGDRSLEELMDESTSSEEDVDESTSSEEEGAENGAGAQVPQPTGENASTNDEYGSPALAETERLPDHPIPSFEAEMLEARERLNRERRIISRLSSGEASEEELRSLHSGELERSVNETWTRFRRAYARREREMRRRGRDPGADGRGAGR